VRTCQEGQGEIVLHVYSVSIDELWVYMDSWFYKNNHKKTTENRGVSLPDAGTVLMSAVSLSPTRTVPVPISSVECCEAL
jgi:hypothetical protein